MADERETGSLARSLAQDTPHLQSSLDQQKPISTTFEKAADELKARQRADLQADKAQSQGTGRNSSQVAKSAPGMRPTPPPGSVAVDRQAHEARRNEDATKARYAQSAKQDKPLDEATRQRYHERYAEAARHQTHTQNNGQKQSQ